MSLEGFAVLSTDRGARLAYGGPERGLALLEGGPWALGPALTDLDAVARATAGSNRTLDWADARFRPPLIPTSRIFCIGRNYADHDKEMGGAAKGAAEAPIVFSRWPQSLTGHGQPLHHPEGSESYDYEGELALVIGRGGRAIEEADALDAVAGYACFFDGTARDFQKHSFFAGKNFDRSGAMGPLLVPAPRVGDPMALRIVTEIGGERLQDGTTADMTRSVAALIAYVSKVTELRPGDVIATGTPAGVGAGRTPPRWIRKGETIRVSIEGVGTLSCPVD